jgi:hypothetical protein
MDEDIETLIKNAYDWLDENEPNWNLDTPIDREAFIKQLLEKRTERSPNG